MIVSPYKNSTTLQPAVPFYLQAVFLRKVYTMIIDNIEIGEKAKFKTIEDVLQTFFCIAGAVYQVVSDGGDINECGVLEMLATDSIGRIRIRVDYVKEGEENDL